MKKCLVIGGGFAGLSASAYLVNSGFDVELIEASPKLGGRAYSFLHKETNTIIDNGQHIMMGCYDDTMSFLAMIGVLDKVQVQQEVQVKVQEKLNVNFLKPGFELHQLRASSLPYPFNLQSAIINYSAITFRERLSILRFFLKLPFLAQRDLLKMTVDELLTKENQNENVRKAFWEVICVGALNTNLKNASAKIFVDILKEIFLKGSSGSKIILPRSSLSEMYCEPARQFIEGKGGRISLSERVEEIKADRGKAVEVISNNRSITDFDIVICAVPHYALENIINLAFLNNHSEINSESKANHLYEEQMLKQSALGGLHDRSRPNIQSFSPQYSSILNVHVWLTEAKKGNRFNEDFYALIDSKLHWVFIHDSHLTCVISDADYLMNLSDEEIMNMICSELEKYLSIKKNVIQNYFFIKEKRATFIPSNKILNNRPNIETGIKNLFLAGDWVNTGLPSTIESAVRSGRLAAEFIVSGL